VKDELFDELLESVREGGAILRGESEASRNVVLERRERHGKSPDAVQAEDEPREG
jgi:hypothetical protein